MRDVHQRQTSVIQRTNITKLKIWLFIFWHVFRDFLSNISHSSAKSDHFSPLFGQNHQHFAMFRHFLAITTSTHSTVPTSQRGHSDVARALLQNGATDLDEDGNRPGVFTLPIYVLAKNYGKNVWLTFLNQPSWRFSQIPVEGLRNVSWFFFVIFSTVSRWWFQIFFMFISTWGNDPIWLIFFKWVETTN